MHKVNAGAHLGPSPVAAADGAVLNPSCDGMLDALGAGGGWYWALTACRATLSMLLLCDAHKASGFRERLLAAACHLYVTCLSRITSPCT